MNTVSGFSKYTKEQKQDWLIEHCLEGDVTVKEVLDLFELDADNQKIIDGISENPISNFVLPYSIAPNFVVDDKVYAVPMVIEESSVVAAAAAAAKFWSTRGGFRTSVISTEKIGQVHFLWKTKAEKLTTNFATLKVKLMDHVASLTANMQKRGGGILDIELKDKTDIEAGLFQLHVTFETCDSMGANFINTVLESFAQKLDSEYGVEVEVIMSILSNYVPECVVRAEVSADLNDERPVNGVAALEFARKFKTAVAIASGDVYRATTHNKGFFNGVDAVALATGNDFRAIEACAHAFCSKDGTYRSISNCSVENGVFRFWVDLPIALGTVGGLTKLHPLAKLSLDILGQPSARELMSIFASVGLAQNFAAVRSLVTTGIQKGHMKMHLSNILNQLKATDLQTQKATAYFADKTVSVSGVREYIEGLGEVV